MPMLGFVKVSGSWRKFHRILDEISNSSNTSLPAKLDQGASASTTDLSYHATPAKRPRVTSNRHSIAVSHLSGLPRDPFSTLRSTSRPATSDQTEPPRHVLGFFAPWDRDQFLGRLNTFSHERFKPKPSAISEAEWAKRGWSCVGEETVACVGGCEARVVIDLKLEVEEDPEESSIEARIEAYKARKSMEAQLVQKYTELLINAHGEDCPWHKRGCSASIQQLPLFEGSATIAGVRKRYESLIAVSDKLPDSMIVPPDYDAQKLLKLMPKSFLEETTSDEQGAIITKARNINLKAFTMSLFGWSAHESLQEIVTCRACFRRLGLWIFRSAPDKDPLIPHLDVMEEHREYCPWKNGSTQNSESLAYSNTKEMLPGYKELATVIQNAWFLRREHTSAAAEAIPPTSPTSSVPAVILTPSAAARDRVVALATQLTTPTESPPKVQVADEEAKDKARWTRLKALRKALHLNMGKNSGK